MPGEYCEHGINDNTSLTMLLPTRRGQGLCATALVHRIINIHNDFIEEYASIKKQPYVKL